jgi:hypothetical protein
MTSGSYRDRARAEFMGLPPWLPLDPGPAQAATLAGVLVLAWFLVAGVRAVRNPTIGRACWLAVAGGAGLVLLIVGQMKDTERSETA